MSLFLHRFCQVRALEISRLAEPALHQVDVTVQQHRDARIVGILATATVRWAEDQPPKMANIYWKHLETKDLQGLNPGSLDCFLHRS